MMKYFTNLTLIFSLVFASNTHAADPAVEPNVKPATEEAVSFLPPVAVEVTSTDVNPTAEFKALAEVTPELEIEVIQTRTARALMAGHGKQLKAKVIEILTRLGIEGDPTKIKVTVNASPVVNASIRTVAGVAEVEINAGLLGLVRNEDELAFILGHELTHGNSALFKLPKDPARVKEILSKLPSSLGNGHIEELRADLGSVHRLIQAGYNPWGGYDAMKRIAAMHAEGRTMNYTNEERRMANLKAFVRSHPDSELRMSAMKSYVTLRQQSENLSNVLSKKSEFTGGMKALQLKMMTYQAMGNPYFRRSYIYKPIMYATAAAAGDAIFALFMSPESSQLAAIFHASLNTVGPIAASAWELLSQAPDGAVKLIQILKEMPAEKAAQIVALFASSTAGLKWGHSKYRQSKEDKLIGKVRALLAEHYPVLKLVEGRVPRVIALQREFAGKGVFDRTGSLANALEMNAKVLKAFEHVDSLAYIAKDAGFPAELIQSRIIQPMREEALARQKLLHTLVEEFMPRIPNAQMTAIVKQIEKIPQSMLLGPELRDSMESLASSSKKQFPTMRFSTSIERALLAQSRTDSSIARTAVESTTESLDSIMVKAEELMRGIARTPLLDKPADGALPRMKPLKVTEQGIHGPQIRKLFQMTEPYVEQWVAAAAEPGARGERAAELFRRTHTELMGAREVLTAEEMRRLQSSTISSLAENRGEPAKIRIMSLERTIAFPAPVSNKERAVFQKTRDAINPYPKLWASLEKFKSVKELDAYIQSEFVERQGLKPTDWPFKDLYQWIEKRPGLLQTKDDIDLLLNRPYYWNTMGTGNTKLDRVLVESLQSTMQANGKLWEYRPEYSEKLQKRILEKMSSLGIMPTDRSGELVLWQKFVGRGVTNTTDQMFGKLFESAADPAEKFRLSGLTKGRLWEPQLRAKTLKVRLDRTKEMKLLAETANELRPSRDLQLERAKALREVARLSEAEFSGRGPEYNAMIEKVADQAKTSQFEERFLDRYRGPTGVGQADVTTRTLSSLSEAVQRLSKEEKWQMILWLRGERPANKTVEDLFPVIGSDRVQRIYSLLPEYQKAVFLDNILDSSTGLMPKGTVKDGWGKTIVDYLVGGGKTASKEGEKSRAIAREVLEAYLGSFDGGTGNKAQRTLVLSYMLASKGGDGSNGRVLKQVLEAMGASGVKIGQFIVAADILPESDNATLRTLQDQANKPKRSRMYADISKAMHGEAIPGKLDDLLGAASVKYAAKALDLDDGHPFVLKVLRAEASATVDQQFDRLNGMADILKKQHGSKYSVLRSIIRASREAIHRELKLDNEVRNSADATREVYSKLSDFEVPKEKLVDATMIKSEYADGTSIHDLMPEAKGRAALRIMQIEGDNLFNDQDVITFDPDRHPGNFKIHADPSGKLTFRPIDFGQVLQITRAERDRVVDLFAISGIMDRYGSTDWAAKLILEKLELPVAKSSLLRKLLAKSYPATNRSPLASYYSLLSALEEIGHPMSIQYFDFARAVVQHNQYLGVIKENAPELMTASFRSPRDRLTMLATARAEEFGKNVNLSTGDKVRFVVEKGVETVKAGVARGFSCIESFGKIPKVAAAH